MKKINSLILLLVCSIISFAQVSNVPPEIRTFNLSTGQPEVGPPQVLKAPYVTPPPGQQAPSEQLDDIWTFEGNIDPAKIFNSGTTNFCPEIAVFGDRWPIPLPPTPCPSCPPSPATDQYYEFFTDFNYTKTAGCEIIDVSLDMEIEGNLGKIFTRKLTVNGAVLQDNSGVLIHTIDKNTSMEAAVSGQSPLPPNRIYVDGTTNEFLVNIMTREFNDPINPRMEVCGEVIIQEVCCDPGTPINLATNFLSTNEYRLNWGDNSILENSNTYDVDIKYNDADCISCNGSIPNTTIYGLTIDSYTFTPNSGCFSWRVRAVCSDGTEGLWSDYQTMDKLYKATNLSSDLTLSGQTQLSWDYNFPADEYKIRILYEEDDNSNKPNPCGLAKVQNPNIQNITVPATQTDYTFTPAHCNFAWNVRAVCGGNVGRYSAKRCYDNCGTTPPGPGPLRKKDPSLTEEKVEDEKQEISILPNPTSGVFNIQAANFDAFEYRVTDYNGKLIIDQTVVSGNTMQVDLSNQPNGLYFISIESEGRSEIIKLMKQD